VRQSTEGVAKDQVHALNYERHRRVISFKKPPQNFNCGSFHTTLSIKLFLDAFLHNNHICVLSIALVHYKQYSTHVYCVFSNHVDVVVV
jgi:hypothetical protein